MKCLPPIALAITMLVLGCSDPLADGQAAFQSKRFDLAYRELRPLADAENAEACYLVAEMYSSGHGAEWNLDEAVRFYRVAARQDHLAAQRTLGGLYSVGRGVPKDLNESQHWFEKVAEKGDMLAIVRLCEIARPRAKSDDAFRPVAVRWCRAAAEGGDALSQKFWADMLVDGEWVRQDLAAAYAWYEISPRGRHYQFDPQALTAQQRADAEEMIERWNRNAPQSE